MRAVLRDWIANCNCVAPSILCHEVDDEHVLEVRAGELAEGLVGGIDQISVAVFLAAEGQDEAVGEALVALLGTDMVPQWSVSTPGILVLSWRKASSTALI